MPEREAEGKQETVTASPCSLRLSLCAPASDAVTAVHGPLGLGVEPSLLLALGQRPPPAEVVERGAAVGQRNFARQREGPQVADLQLRERPPPARHDAAIVPRQ